MKQLNNRSFLSAGLLISSLLLLSGCMPDWSKKSGCVGCDVADSKAGGEVLLTINGKPRTTEDFEVFWQEFLNSDPQAALMAQFMPNAREEMFKNYETEELIKEWIRANKKDQEAEYLKAQKKAHQQADRTLNITSFKDDAVKNLDMSDAGLKSFYEENRDKNAVFNQPPFLLAAEGIKAQQVLFGDEKSAKEFADRAKKAGANFGSLAKAAKKDVKDLGLVTAQSRSVEPTVRVRLKDMKEGSVDVVNVGPKQFAVVKAGAKQQNKFAGFDEPNVKEALKEVMPQMKAYEAIMARVEDLKKEYKVEDEKGKEFFKKEAEEKKAKMQEELKAAQEAAKAQPAGEQALEAVDTAAQVA